MPYTKQNFTGGASWNQSEVTISLNAIAKSRSEYPRVSTTDYTNLTPSTNKYYDTNYGTQGFANAESLRPYIQNAINELTKHLDSNNIKLRILSPSEDQSQADITVSLAKDLQTYQPPKGLKPAQWVSNSGTNKAIDFPYLLGSDIIESHMLGSFAGKCRELR